MKMKKQQWDTYSDTWTATDGLGRELPDVQCVGEPRKNKFVGMFYFLWMGVHGRKGPFNIDHILKENPQAIQDPDDSAWGPKQAYHHWGEPLLDYYLSDDAYVIYKHAQMLADAGVDVIVFDVTNQYTYKENYMALLKVFARIRENGGKTPDIAFLTPFHHPTAVVESLFFDLYKPELYKDLWFEWKGKPLILADREKVNDEHKDFFTFRKPEPTYFEGPSGPDEWGWSEVYPQHAFYNNNGEAEQVVVSVAQNAVGGRLGCLSEEGAYGRSYHQGNHPEKPYPTDEGLNFKEQWEHALKIDPEFIFVTGWNEWIAMRLDEFNGVREPVMFVDQFNPEFSRDIEPMKSGHKDHYYYQLVNYIRQFKGVRTQPQLSEERTINLKEGFQQWKNVKPEYRDDIGDNVNRNHPAWKKGKTYNNTSGRNDFVQLKVARNQQSIFFYVQTLDPITSYTDPQWMFLFIKIRNYLYAPNWEGYHFLVNRNVVDAETTVLEKCKGGWAWEQVAHLPYHVEGNELHLEIPRSILGLEKGQIVDLEFKWADNMQEEGDIMAFTLYGDSAPNGRFNYVFKEIE